MLDIFSEYAVDPKAEQEGRWFPIGGNAKVLVARANNPAYLRMLNARFEQFQHVLSKKDTAADLEAAKECSAKIMAEVAATTLLLGFEGLGYQKEPIEYSIPNAQKLLMHEEFFRVISNLANDFRNYRYQLEEADGKNSGTTSAGS